MLPASARWATSTFWFARTPHKRPPNCSRAAATISNTLTAAIKQLGGTPVAKPTFSFPVTNESSFLALASVLENTGVGAYNGAAPSLQSKAVLASAGSIVQTEARHAAAIDRLHLQKTERFELAQGAQQIRLRAVGQPR